MRRIVRCVVAGLVLTDGQVVDLAGATARSLPVVFGKGAPENIRAAGVSADGTTVLGRGSVWARLRWPTRPSPTV
ncbi:MAG: hypothetical protein QM619_03335 [Micropruina sp.]|uniref:hypothetical protein n=1 Tax=Micropruina sp. TaxID=2737536 RepID=UPI0039E5C6EF